jgi:predicted nucleotidyltransferase
MGGSGGGTFSGRTPGKLRDLVRKAEKELSEAAFDGELSHTLGELLVTFNGRDVELVRERLDQAKAALEDELDGSLDQLFGGSVAKHTYVDGLSDIDSLLVINDTDLEDKEPSVALAKMERILKKRLAKEANVSHGRMAVTLEYPDGMSIQLLPALEGPGKQVHVPSSRTTGWSKIDPVAFQKALTRRNDECAGKLVPTIKLAKAIVGQLPPAQRLSGYHMESLAIAAFRGYDGEKITRAMLPIFFDKAKDIVLTPIKDRSGQSIHVDAYMGDANSEERQLASHVLGRIARRMRNATASGSTAQWRALFGIDE